MKQINSDVIKKTLHKSKKGGFPEENKSLYSIPVTLSHIQNTCDADPSISGHFGNNDHPFFVNNDDNVHSVSVDGDSIDNIQPLPVDGDDENNGHTFSIGDDSDDYDHSYSVNSSDFDPGFSGDDGDNSPFSNDGCDAELSFSDEQLFVSSASCSEEDSLETRKRKRKRSFNCNRKHKVAVTFSSVDFRKAGVESKHFNGKLFFHHNQWKQLSSFRVSQLPQKASSYDSFLKGQFMSADNNCSVGDKLYKNIGPAKSFKLSKMRAFLAACFTPLTVSSSVAQDFLCCNGVGIPYPQFSCPNSAIVCEICVPFQRWAMKSGVGHSSLRCKGATIDAILKNSFAPNFSGLRQAYEHSVSKSHLEAITFVTSIELNKPNKPVSKPTSKGPKQQNLISYFGASNEDCSGKALN